MRNKDFPDGITSPSLTKEQTDSSDSPLTPAQPENNKVSGLDGSSAQFYKHFWQILSSFFIQKQQSIPSYELSSNKTGKEQLTAQVTEASP